MEDECRYVGRAVAQDKGRYAITLKPSPHSVALIDHVVPEIAATGADNDGRAIAARSQIWRQHGADVLDLTGLNRYDAEAEQQHDEEK